MTGAPQVDVTEPAGEVRRRLLAERHASGVDLAACHDGRLVGIVPLERLLAAEASAPVLALLDPRAVIDRAETPVLVAATRAAQAGARCVAVTDAAGRLRGLVPAARLMAVLVREHERNLARASGVLAATQGARRASVEPVRRRLWHRLPWLGLGLAGAMASAAIVASYEEALERQVLAFFVPAVVSMADAVGIQTEAIVIRGLSVGVRLREIVVRELLTGLLPAALLSAAFAVFALAIWGDGRVSATVALALFVSSSIATVVAVGLPDLVFGANDGLITTFAVVSGVVGASLEERVILILGFANLIADGFSMGASNCLSLRSHVDEADRVDRSAAVSHGTATLVGFVSAGVVPLVAYLVPIGADARYGVAIALTATTLVAVGAARALATRLGLLRSGPEMLAVGSLAAGVAYAVGALAALVTDGAGI